MNLLTDINYIHDLLARHGFRFSKSLGQNFLTASWVPEDIAESALLDENTGVLEIGAGVGCLTRELSARAGKVVCVELDRTLEPILAETLIGCKNVEMVYGDILKQDIPALVAQTNRRTFVRKNAHNIAQQRRFAAARRACDQCAASTELPRRIRPAALYLVRNAQAQAADFAQRKPVPLAGHAPAKSHAVPAAQRQKARARAGGRHAQRPAAQRLRRIVDFLLTYAGAGPYFTIHRCYRAGSAGQQANIARPAHIQPA